MQGTRTWIIAVVALIIGVAAGYVYMQGQASGLAGQVSALQSQLAEANEKAKGAASEIETLKAGLDEKSKLVEQQQARIAELEAQLKAAMQPAEPPAQQPGQQ